MTKITNNFSYLVRFFVDLYDSVQGHCHTPKPFNRMALSRLQPVAWCVYLYLAIGTIQYFAFLFSLVVG